MTQMLKSSDRGLKIIISNKLKALMEKMPSMQDQMDNFRREQNIQELWGDNKWYNICIIGIPE